ncbi:hypothetical protein GQR58_026831 [Nymphon striatum]|nr:hypothetical protein GQR58_026831 [Nymphon striatum]
MIEAVQSYVIRGICIQRRTLLRPEWTTTGGADAQQFLIHDSGADAHNRMLVFRTEQGLQHFYAILSGKSQDDYEELLQSIVKECESTGYSTDPLTFVTDFELAAIRTLETTFGPHVRCQGCFYHLTQSIWRKIQELVQVELYKNNEDVKLYCGMLDGLAFLPEDKVVRGMDYLKESAPEELTDLLTYFDFVYEPHVFTLSLFILVC